MQEEGRGGAQEAFAVRLTIRASRDLRRLATVLASTPFLTARSSLAATERISSAFPGSWRALFRSVFNSDFTAVFRFWSRRLVWTRFSADLWRGIPSSGSFHVTWRQRVSR